MSRATVMLDDDLVEEARRLSGLKTKREVIDEALRTLVRLRRQVGLRTLRGTLRWEGDMRASRLSRDLDRDPS